MQNCLLNDINVEENFQNDKVTLIGDFLCFETKLYLFNFCKYCFASPFLPVLIPRTYEMFLLKPGFFECGKIVKTTLN